MFGARKRGRPKKCDGQKSKKLYLIEKILKQRTQDGSIQYLIKWKGYSTKYNSWEPKSMVHELKKKNIENQIIKIKKFKNNVKNPNGAQVSKKRTTPKKEYPKNISEEEMLKSVALIRNIIPRREGSG